MNKILAFIFFIVIFCCFSFAQSHLLELEKVRDIKLLESNRADVKKVLAEYEHDDSDDESNLQTFSAKNVEIEVTFSNGKCSGYFEHWNVPEGIVSKVRIKPEKPIKLKKFKYDFSNFKKETEEEESPESYRYHDENAGIVFKIEDGEIQEVIFYPPQSKIGFLCESENALEVLSGQESLVDLALQEGCELINTPANVTELKLSAEEIIKCSSAVKNQECKNDNSKITVTTTAVDSENDVLTYNYIVSGGKIIGSGQKVVWDLTDVRSGTYTVTAGVDDGCGICGETKTQTVIIK